MTTEHESVRTASWWNESSSGSDKFRRSKAKLRKQIGLSRRAHRKLTSMHRYLREVNKLRIGSITEGSGHASKNRNGPRSLLVHCVLLFTIVIITPLEAARAQVNAVTDSFTLIADLSGGDVVCSANSATPLAIGTQMYIPVAGSWQAAWHSSFYVTFGNSRPSALQFIFLVFNGGTLKETVKYNVEPSLFQVSTTKEFAFSVGTYGNDGDASGLQSAAPFYMTIQYYCLSAGQPVTVKGSSHILQWAWPE